LPCLAGERTRNLLILVYFPQWLPIKIYLLDKLNFVSYLFRRVSFGRCRVIHFFPCKKTSNGVLMYLWFDFLQISDRVRLLALDHLPIWQLPGFKTDKFIDRTTQEVFLKILRFHSFLEYWSIPANIFRNSIKIFHN
jgi:hypothetical protein